MRPTLSTRRNTIAQLKSSLEYKSKELATLTLHLIYKNNFLREIEDEVQAIKKTTPEETVLRLHKLAKRIHFLYQTNQDWNYFTTNLEQVSPSFLYTLKQRYPELTTYNLKLCALIRLDFNAKQIAGIMAISPGSVKVAKHRLRKKLGLTQIKNLHTFLTELDTIKKMDNGTN